MSVRSGEDCLTDQEASQVLGNKMSASFKDKGTSPEAQLVLSQSSSLCRLGPSMILNTS